MKGKILIADDEPHIRQLVNNALGKDYSILQASNGEEAMNIALSQKPDLILMDIVMPKVDGYSACSQIKSDQVTKGIPVVMITGIGFKINEKVAKDLGADGYITKPFTLESLVNIAEQYVPAPQTAL
jgi:two-component system alkaline phosphatase synthesis response regulator PhoP